MSPSGNYRPVGRQRIRARIAVGPCLFFPRQKEQETSNKMLYLSLCNCIPNFYYLSFGKNTAPTIFEKGEGGLCHLIHPHCYSFSHQLTLHGPLVTAFWSASLEQWYYCCLGLSAKHVGETALSFTICPLDSPHHRKPWCDLQAGSRIREDNPLTTYTRGLPSQSSG